MNTIRTRVNWISASLAAISVLVYLIAPFYSALSLEISGYRLISINALALFPVLLGIVSILGACLFPPIIAIIVEFVHLISVFIFMCMGNMLIAPIINNSLNIPPEWSMSVNTVLSTLPTIRPSWGAVLCIGFCVSVIVFDIIANYNRTPPPKNPYIIGQDSNDPFNSNMF